MGWRGRVELRVSAWQGGEEQGGGGAGEVGDEVSREKRTESESRGERRQRDREKRGRLREVEGPGEKKGRANVDCLAS